jgi:hypothetical protein
MISFYLRVGLSSGLFPLGFPTKQLDEFVISPMHATCTTHLIPLDLITLITFGEAYDLWSFLRALVTTVMNFRFPPASQELFSMGLIIPPKLLTEKETGL